MFRLLVLVSLVAASVGCKAGDSPADVQRREIRSIGLMEAEKARFAADPGREALAPEPYLNGKAVLLRAVHESVPDDMPAVEPLYIMERPDAWRTYFDSLETPLAASVEEVGTVARLDCTEEPAGTYVSDAGIEVNATRETCTLTLVDLSIPAVIHREPFQAHETPETVGYDFSRGQGVKLQVRTHEVMDFLARLPRR